MLDEKNTTVHVSGDNLFGRLVPNVTREVTQGTTVHFDVIVENRGNYPAYDVPIRVYYAYQTPEGEFSDSIVFERSPREIEGGAQYYAFNSIWSDGFNITPSNVGAYYFTLYVNGEIEDDVKITVEPNGSVAAWMECNPEFVSENDDSVTCNVKVKNLGNAPLNFEVTDVYFAGGQIYDSGKSDNFIVPKPRSLDLGPNSLGVFAFTIPINDELQKRIALDLQDINLGTPVAIKARLHPPGKPVMCVVQMNPRPVTAGDVARDAYHAVKIIKDEIVGTYSKGATIGGAIGGPPGAVIGGAIALYLKLWWDVLHSPVPVYHGDNNQIIGD